MAEYIHDHYRFSEQRACRLMQLPRSVYRYRSVMDPKLDLRHRMRALAHSRVRHGDRRIHVLLRREGFRRGKIKPIGSIAKRLYSFEASSRSDGRW